jgi:hypothetical protein
MCKAWYSDFLLLNRRKGSINSGRSERREMLKAPYLLMTASETSKKSEKYSLIISGALSAGMDEII